MGYTTFTIKGFGWMGLLQFFTRILTFVKVVIIIRLLTPQEFGIFGMTMIVVALVETFTEIGISTFLIQQGGKVREYINDAWVVQIVRGFFATVIILILSFPSALFFNEHQLTIFIAIASLNPLIKSFENPYVIGFQKNLMFHKEFLYRLIVPLTDLIVSVALVIYTHSVVGLIFGLLLSTFLGIFLSWMICNARPSFTINKKKILEITHFVKWITPLGIFSYLASSADQILVGRILGAGQLGIYQVAQKFSSTPMIELSDVVGKVTLPVYVKITHDIPRIKRAYIRTFLSLAILELTLVLVLLFFSKEIMLIFAGPRWSGGDDVVKILAVYGFIFSISGTIGSLFYSLKKQKILTLLSVARLIFIVLLALPLINTFGLLGAGYALFFSSLCMIPITVYYIHTSFNKSY